MKRVIQGYGGLVSLATPNVKAHNITGRETLAHTAGKVDVFVAVVGTGGTLLGVAEVLKEKNPDVRVIAVEPASSEMILISGWHEIKEEPEVSGGIIKEIIDRGIVDEVVKVSDEDAIKMAYRLSREEGLFAGMSAGANVFVAVNQAKKLSKEEKA